MCKLTARLPSPIRAETIRINRCGIHWQLDSLSSLPLYLNLMVSLFDSIPRPSLPSPPAHQAAAAADRRLKGSRRRRHRAYRGGRRGRRPRRIMRPKATAGVRWPARAPVPTCPCTRALACAPANPLCQRLQRTYAPPAPTARPRRPPARADRPCIPRISIPVPPAHSPFRLYQASPSARRSPPALSRPRLPAPLARTINGPSSSNFEMIYIENLRSF